MRILRTRRDLVVRTGLMVMLVSACGCAGPNTGPRAADPARLPLIRLMLARPIPTAHVVPLRGPPRSFIGDFELHGETLDLLDLATHEITEYRRQDGAWSFTQFVARPSVNRSPLRTVTGMTRIGDSLVLVGADATLQIVGPETDHNRSFRVAPANIECDPLRPSIIALATGELLIAGSCLGDDEVLRESLWRGDLDGHFTRIATELRVSADGDAGYLLAATRSLTATASGALFGVGATNCLWQLNVAQHGLPHRQCPLVTFGYRVGDPRGDAHRALADFRLRHRVSGPAFEWHEQLPLYVDRMEIGPTIVLVRRAAPDTLVFVRADADASDPPLFIGPSPTFVGCKRDACLWFQPSTPSQPGDWVAVVTADSLATLIHTAATARPARLHPDDDRNAHGHQISPP